MITGLLIVPSLIALGGELRWRAHSGRLWALVSPLGHFVQSKGGRGLVKFYNAVEDEGILDKKRKALIAIAVHGRCDHCTKARMKKALSLGINKRSGRRNYYDDWLTLFRYGTLLA